MLEEMENSAAKVEARSNASRRKTRQNPQAINQAQTVTKRAKKK